MALDVSIWFIFLASPGGTEAHRAIIRDEVHCFNVENVRRTKKVFFVSGYEDLHGEVGRPQDVINPLIRKCDYMILFVQNRLGSPTTKTPPFRTGIEEELSVALEELANTHQPMRDIMAAFETQTPSLLRRRTKELRQVLKFKYMIEATKELLYVPYNTEVTLRKHIRGKLEDWCQSDDPPHKPVSTVRLSAALQGNDRPVMSDPPTNDPEELVRWAQEQARQGLNTTADIAFATAIADNNPHHLHAYAKFLQRTGRLEEALTLDQRALRKSVATGSNDLTQVRIRAELLGHMGLLKRKLGNLPDSRKLLSQAVETARLSEANMAESLAYALDQLGITDGRLGDLQAAEKAFSEALEIRRICGDTSGRAQSLINLARVAKQRDDIATTVSQLQEAIRLLGSDRTRQRANALAALGEAYMLLAPPNLKYAKDLLTESLDINRSLDISDGVSVASNGLARIALAVQDMDEALRYADQVMEVSVASGNQEGVAIAYRLKGDILLREAKPAEALMVLEHADRLVAAHRDPARQAQVRLSMALASSQLGDSASTAEHVRVGRAAAKRGGDQSTLTRFDEFDNRDA